MKRKLILFTAILAILLIIAVVLTGCGAVYYNCGGKLYSSIPAGWRSTGESTTNTNYDTIIYCVPVGGVMPLGY